MKKKLVSLITILTIILNLFCQTVSAYENKSIIKLNTETIIECVQNIALGWAKMVEPNIDLNLGSINKINIINSNDVEYTVSYFSGKLPYGYAVVIFQNNEAVIKEANLTPGQESIYTELVDTVIDVTDTSRSNLDISNQLIEISPTQYALSAKNNRQKGKTTKVYDIYGNIISSNDLVAESTKYSKADSIFISSDSWTNSKYKVDKSSKIILKKYTNRPKLFGEWDIENLTNKYCCVTQALLQIAYMEKLTNGSDSSIKTTYNKLWNYCKISETKKSKKNTAKYKIQYGEGTLSNANNGFVKLAKEKGYSRTKTNSIKKNPSVSWIKDKLKHNRPILMFFGINVDGKRNGHAISILGYMKAKKVSSGKTWNYLMVYDSWSRSAYYLNYSTVDFMDCSAAYFWVKK